MVMDILGMFARLSMSNCLHIDKEIIVFVLLGI